MLIKPTRSLIDVKYIYCYSPNVLCYDFWLKLYHASTQSVTFNNWQGGLGTITPVFRYWAIQCWRTYRSEKAMEVYTITSTCYSSKGVRRNMYTNSGKLTQKMPYYTWILVQSSILDSFSATPTRCVFWRGRDPRPCKPNLGSNSWCLTHIWKLKLWGNATIQIPTWAHSVSTQLGTHVKE